MMRNPLSLSILETELSICSLPAGEAIPPWCQGSFVSVTRTGEELSIVCESAQIPEGTLADHGWRALKVQGPLDFDLTGVLASLSMPLAEAGISIFAISTFDTDFLLVRNEKLQSARTVLREAGHSID